MTDETKVEPIPTAADTQTGAPFYLFRRQFHTARPSGQGALDGAAETEQTDCDPRLGASKKGGPIGSPG
jgi:hypothetical protein